MRRAFWNEGEKVRRRATAVQRHEPDESKNCQVGVFLALSTSRGRALIDRALYLPQVWCDDKPRRDEAGVPEAVEFGNQAEAGDGDAGSGIGVRSATARFVLADEVYPDRTVNSGGFWSRRASRLSSPFRVSSGCGLGWSRNGSIRLPASIPEKAWFRA